MKMKDEQINGLSPELRAEVERIILQVERVAGDVTREVARMLQDAAQQPLSPEETIILLERVVLRLRESAAKRGDAETLEALAGDIQKIAHRVLTSSEGTDDNAPAESEMNSLLIKHNGIDVRAVHPTPWFHGKEVPMMSGYVRTRDIKLWAKNERLDIHLNQFQATHARKPTPEELLDIMLNKLPLPGIEKGDAFKIIELARSIASNGVRKPPIIDLDGTLLDGNRRVTACYYILNNDEFSNEQKKRAECIFVWQLTQHATEDDRERVVVSLNFEDDCKEEWPKYVKARKVAEAWQELVALEPVPPHRNRQAQLKRQLSERFALGPNTVAVTNYLRMVQWADDFEHYLVEVCGKDPFEVKHRAEIKFDYFDEFSKGVSPGTVAYNLNQDEDLKHLAFDLHFQDKFKNWNLIRDLKYVGDNNEVKAKLREVRDMTVNTQDDLEAAQEAVEDAVSIVKMKRAETRSVGVNTRIETFCKWLEDLPLKTVRDEITIENLQWLLKTLALVQQYAEQAVQEKTAATSSGSRTA
jgi:hypothetical protein